MESTITPISSNQLTSMSSVSCPPNQVAIRPGDCVESEVEEWLENETVAGFRVWQLAGIILSIILAITVAFCCCMRFRIPRTKQNIEADHIRKRITQNFRKELAKISNTDMDEMDLRKALERVRDDLDAENEEIQKRQNIFIEKSQDGMRARFHAIFYRMRTRFSDNTLNQPNNNVI